MTVYMRDLMSFFVELLIIFVFLFMLPLCLLIFMQLFHFVNIYYTKVSHLGKIILISFLINVRNEILFTNFKQGGYHLE